jgi:hypothetical protein
MGPKYVPSSASRATGSVQPFGRRLSSREWLLVLFTVALLSNACLFYSLMLSQDVRSTRTPLDAHRILSKCRAIRLKPTVPPGFHARTTSDRFQDGTSPVLIKNASIWTGRLDGREVVKGDLLMDKGIIKAFGDVNRWSSQPENLVVKDVHVCLQSISRERFPDFDYSLGSLGDSRVCLTSFWSPLIDKCQNN